MQTGPEARCHRSRRVLEESHIIGIRPSNTTDRSTENPGRHETYEETTVIMRVSRLPRLTPGMLCRFVEWDGRHHEYERSVQGTIGS